MTPRYMRRRRVAVLVMVLLLALAAAAHKAMTRTPSDIGRAAVSAVQADNPGRAKDEWSVTCESSSERTYTCIVTWKQIGIAPADAPGDFCEEFAVEVRDGRVAMTPVRVENEDGVSLRKC